MTTPGSVGLGQGGRATDEGTSGLLRRWPVHPLLLAAFPVLFLWGRNTSEVVPGDVWPVLGIVVAAAGGVWLAAALGYRNLRRGALLTSVTTAAFLSYGHVGQRLPASVGVMVLLALAVATGALILRAKGSVLSAATRFANVLAIVLVATTVVPLAGEARGADPGDGEAGRTELGVDPAGGGTDQLPDIVYIVPDRYGRADSLEQLFGIDNGPFIQFLEDQGFDVLDRALANYPKTAHSLASSLNMTYLDELERTVPDASQDDYEPAHRMVRDHEIGRVLTELGYEYVHLGTWWSPTASAASADRVLTYDQSSEFEQVFELTTALPAVQDLLGLETSPDRRRLRRRHSEHQLDTLLRLAAEPSGRPRFIFAHITLPHEPYTFAADGSFVPRDVEASRSRAENYSAQLQYLNGRLEQIVRRLTEPDRHRPAAVVIQADEGPTPVRAEALDWEYSWVDAPDEELREKLRIFAAYRLPGVADDEIPEDLSPVNTFRLILRHYTGAELDLLPDRAFVFPERAQLYRFVDVTDRVRG